MAAGKSVSNEAALIAIGGSNASGAVASAMGRASKDFAAAMFEIDGGVSDEGRSIPKRNESVNCDFFEACDSACGHCPGTLGIS
jgi:hypothetical protein